ncbi:transhydrogenase [Cryptosporidium felis]|nr:transhydrogenase [Cryptosporidium felis]
MANKFRVAIALLLLLALLGLGDVNARLQGKAIGEGFGFRQKAKTAKPGSFLQISSSSQTSPPGPIVIAGQLFAALSFFYCIKGLSSEETAYKSNVVGFIGMVVAIFVTLSEEGFGGHYIVFFLTILLSGAVGVYIADSTKLIKMPQLVAAFHSFVGLAALFVSYSYYYSLTGLEEGISGVRRMEVFIGGAMGTVTFIGSVVAALKLDDILPSKSAKLPFKNPILSLILAAALMTGISFCTSGNELVATTNLHCGMILSALFGLFMIVSIGGADMPIVISMLNSYSGWSTAVSGFLLDNSLLVISGALIGSSGAFLSHVMCKGMNRDFVSVILGGFDQEETLRQIGDSRYCTTSSRETAELLSDSSRVLVVPGYGMAVSRCQDVVSEILRELESRGVSVDVGIHPVAGRMPGHMNVLLAEANVPSRKIKEMEAVNASMRDYDLALVVGANDIVNPAALEPESKVSGMPVISVWEAKQTIVCKRSLAPGYACIDNQLFSMESTKMLLGDARETLEQVCKSLKGYSGSASKQFMDSRVTEEPEDLEETANLLSQASPTASTSSPRPSASKRIALLPVFSEQAAQVLFPIPPSKVHRFRERGYQIAVSADAPHQKSLSECFSQERYLRSGALVFPSVQELLKEAQIVIKMARPTAQEVGCMTQGQVLLCNMYISRHQDKENAQDQLLASLNSKGVTVIALDEVPRTSRAQAMDTKTTNSTIAGYRAVVEALNCLPRISKSISSAAGKVEESVVLVIGVGVAGLQAIATAKSMGARVLAMDPRASTAEEAESCGAKFIQFPRDAVLQSGDSGPAREKVLSSQRSFIEKYLSLSDIVITSASAPGEDPPLLISKEAVRKMKSGSVIVDLCSEFGGNCELTQKEKTCSDVQSGVTIVGKTNYVFSMPLQSSELLSGNLFALVTELGATSESFKCDLNNELVSRMCVAHQGKMLWRPFSEQNRENQENRELQEKKSLSGATPAKQAAPLLKEPLSSCASSPAGSLPKAPGLGAEVLELLGAAAASANLLFYVAAVAAAVLFLSMGLAMTALQIQNVFSFLVSVLLGYYCVSEVDPKLHTPLMSATNALSGVIIVGSMLQYGNQTVTYTTLMAMASTFLASVNTFGGFYVTARMLSLFA